MTMVNTSAYDVAGMMELAQESNDLKDVNEFLLIATGVVALLGGLLTGLTSALARRANKLRREARDKYRAELKKTRNELLRMQQVAGEAAKGLVRDSGTLDMTVLELEGRLDRIEARLPDPKDIDKVASVNEALLSKGLEDLRQAVSKLDERTLSKWDVVTVVFAILTALSIVIAGIVGVVQMLKV